MSRLGKLQQGFGHMIVIATITIVAVGGISVYIMNVSHAATTAPFVYTGCRKIQYSQNSAYVGCVKDIQLILNGITAQYPEIARLKVSGGAPTSKYIATDGYFGASTRGRVKQFQTQARNAGNTSLTKVDVRGLAVDGIVGTHTWDALCRFGAQTDLRPSDYSIYQAGIAAAVAAGCHARFQQNGGGY